MMAWQVQEAKQRFSEVLRMAASHEQIVTRHGEEVAAIIDIEEYRRLKRGAAQRDRAYPGLFPPLQDEEFAKLLEAVVRDRATDTATTHRVTPDFGG